MIGVMNSRQCVLRKIVSITLGRNTVLRDRLLLPTCVPTVAFAAQRPHWRIELCSSHQCKERQQNKLNVAPIFGSSPSELVQH